MRKTDGRRDLALIRASGSTARVLNLALVFERHGDTEEYRTRPLFQNKRLNRALILKHVVRPHERERFNRAPVTATKVVLPYDAKELELGGVSFLVGEKRFEEVLRTVVEGYSDHAALLADAELLQLLADLPSFDPFLTRERLRTMGHEPARIFFDLSEADVDRMRMFVGKEINQLVQLAFAMGGQQAGALSQRLADKLMTDESARALDPLRETLRLSGTDYVEGVFAWKGFLYYKWQMAGFRAALETFKPRFAGMRVLQTDPKKARDFASRRAAVLGQMSAALERVDALLLEYGAAFAALGEGQPGLFREFLLKAPTLFIPMGEAVGVVKHIESFWRFRFPDMSVPRMNAEEADETLQEFELTLGGLEFVKEAAAGVLAL